jgi:hypothetical protein
MCEPELPGFGGFLGFMVMVVAGNVIDFFKKLDQPSPVAVVQPPPPPPPHVDPRVVQAQAIQAVDATFQELRYNMLLALEPNYTPPLHTYEPWAVER